MNPNDASNPALRLPRDQVDALLDQLDRRSEASARFGGDRLARRHPRRRYRLAVKVEIAQPGGTPVRCAVATRNLSRSGVGFIIGQFVYPGSACSLNLVSPHGHSQTAAGKITRCSYVAGSGGVHEVGVKFDEPIDITLFQENSAHSGRAHLLLADNDPAMHRLVKLFLKDVQADLAAAYDGLEAVTTTLAGQFDLVLMDLELPKLDGLAATEELRKRGYVQPIVALTAAAGDGARETALKAGCTAFVTKPIAREALVQLVQGIMTEPLDSALAGDPEMTDLIDTFVAGLSARVLELKTAFDAKDMTAFERVLRQLKGAGASFGFGVITDAAAELENKLHGPDDPAAVREHLNELIRWCRAARPASEI